MKKNNYLHFFAFSLILLVLSLNLNAQQDDYQKKVKALRDSLAVAKEDTNMVLLVLDLYDMGGFQSNNEVKIYLDKALEISKREKYSLGLAYVNESLGDFNTYLKKKDIAFDYYYEAKQSIYTNLNKRIQEKDSIRIALNLFNFARIYTKIGMDDSASITLEKAAQQIISVKQDYIEAGGYYFKTANIYGMLGKFNQALTLHKKGLNLLLTNIPDSVNKIALFYKYISLDYTSLNMLDSAKYYNDLKVKISEENNNPDFLISEGQNYLGLKQYKEALIYFQNALNKFNKDDFFQLANCHSGIGRAQYLPLLESKFYGANIQKEDFNKALASFEESNKIYYKEIEVLTDSSYITENLFKIAENKFYIGNILAQYKDTLAIFNFKEAITILINTDNDFSKNLIIGCNKMIGLFYEIDNRALSTEYYKKALEVCLELYKKDTTNLEKKKELADLYNSIARNISFVIRNKNINEQKEYQSSISEPIDYYLKALKIYSFLEDSIKMAKCFEDLGFCYKDFDDLKAIYYFKNAIEFWEALNIEQLPVRYGSTLEKISFVVARLYGHVGSIYIFNLKDYNNAIEYLTKGIIKYEKNGINQNDYSFEEYLSFYNLLSLAYNEINDFENALKITNNAIMVYQNVNINDKYLEDINELKLLLEITRFKINPEDYLLNNINYENIDYLIKYFQDIVPLEKDPLEQVNTTMTLTMLYFFKLDFTKIKELLNIMKKYPAEYFINTSNYIVTLNGMANLFYEFGEYEYANEIYNTILSFSRTSPAGERYSIDYASYYLYYGRTLQAMGNYQNSIDAFKISAEYYSKKTSENDSINENENKLSEVYFEMASTFDNLNIKDSTLYYYDLALDLSEKTADSSHISMIYTNVGNLAYDYGNQTIGDSLYRLARIYNADRCNECYIVNLIMNADLLIKNKKFSTAKLLLDSALVVSETMRADTKNKKIEGLSSENNLSVIYNTYGVFYEKQNLYQKALSSYQIALNELCKTKDVSIYSNPELSSFPIDAKGIVILQNKARCLNEYFTSNTDQANSDKDIKMALKTSLLCSELIDKVRNFYKDEDMKLVVGEQFNEFYNMSSSIAYKAGDIESFYYFSEKSKAQVLQYIINESDAKIKNVPEETLRKEKQLKQKLIYCKNNYIENNTGITLQDTLFKLNQEYQIFITSIEKGYPEYSALKYSTKVAFMSELQSTLNKENAIIEYSINDSVLTSFFIDKSNFAVHQYSLVNTDLDSLITAYKNALFNATSDSGFYSFQAISHILYNILISPFEEYVKDSVSLIIIPDGILYQIPFEALVIKPNHNHSGIINQKDIDYLIKRNPTSYHYSATLWHNTKKREQEKEYNPTYEYFVAAPFSGLNYPPLSQIKNEKDAAETGDAACENLDIMGYTGTYGQEIYKLNPEKSEILPYNKATLSKVKELMQKSRYVNLLTHGCVDKNEVNLVFYGDIDTTYSYLTIEDVFNLKMNADLVVMAACQSGYGEILNGEGMMSLTRGLLYSGANNIIYGLYPMKSSYMSELVYDFYKECSINKNFSKAFQKAKITLMQNNSVRLKDWSSLILMGVN